MSMLARLRALNMDRMDIDDKVELVTFGRSAIETYASYQVPTPDWLKDAVGQLDAEIKRSRRDMLEARAKEIAASLKSLKSREERRADLEAEAARLRDALGTPAA